MVGAPNLDLLKAMLLKWLEALAMQAERATLNNSESGYSDALLFPLVAALCLDNIEQSIQLNQIHEDEAYSVLEISGSIKCVRNMISHLAEYDAGKGYFHRSSSEFNWVYRSGSTGVTIAGRLNVSDCRNRFSILAHTLSGRDYWGNGRKPLLLLRSAS